LGKKTNDELRQLAIDTGIKRVPTQRNELVLTILSSLSDEKKAIVGAGILDVLSDGFGFLKAAGFKKK
jgi:transcription termination factor Rho